MTTTERQEPLTEQQVKFLKMVETVLRDGKSSKSNVELSFVAQLSDGNVRDSYYDTRVRARNR